MCLKTLNLPLYLSLKMQVNSALNTERGEKAIFMLFSRNQNLVMYPVRKLWVLRDVHYSASSLRLLLFLSLTGGSSVGVLKSWLGRDASIQAYVKVSEGLISRYGRGKGSLACYKLTERGSKLLEDSLQLVRDAVLKELAGLPQKKARKAVKPSDL